MSVLTLVVAAAALLLVGLFVALSAGTESFKAVLLPR